MLLPGLLTICALKAASTFMMLAAFVGVNEIEVLGTSVKLVESR